jgi:protein SMG6
MLSDGPVYLELSQAFKYAMRLALSRLSFVLRNLTRKASPFTKSTLTPYLTILLAFLERFIPREDFAVFFASIPKNTHVSQGLHAPAPTGTEHWVMLTSRCLPLLPEDWCMRGMEWVGRKVFERRYWNSGEDRRV